MHTRINTLFPLRSTSVMASLFERDIIAKDQGTVWRQNTISVVEITVSPK